MMFVGGEITPMEGTPGERPDSGVHWKPSREVILIGLMGKELIDKLSSSWEVALIYES